MAFIGCALHFSSMFILFSDFLSVVLGVYSQGQAGRAKVMTFERS